MVWSNQAPTSITFPPGATTGARMVIDQNGITIYGTDNQIIYQLFSSVSPGSVVETFPYDTVALETPGYISWQDAVVIFVKQYRMMLDNGLVFNSDLWTLLASDGLGSTRQAIMAGPDGTVTIPKLLVAAKNNPAMPVYSLQLGNGYTHRTYFEQTILTAAQALANGVVSPLLWSASSIIKNDYSATNLSAIDATGAFWTCPATGIYEITTELTAAAAAGVAGQIIFVYGHLTTGGSQFYSNQEQFVAGNTIAMPNTFKGFFNAGDLVYPAAFNGTGANTTGAANNITTFQKIL